MPDPFGFEQAKKVYSLQTFGKMANQFKADYFNQQPTVSTTVQVLYYYWHANLAYTCLNVHAVMAYIVVYTIHVYFMNCYYIGGSL